MISAFLCKDLSTWPTDKSPALRRPVSNRSSAHLKRMRCCHLQVRGRLVRCRTSHRRTRSRECSWAERRTAQAVFTFDTGRSRRTVGILDFCFSRRKRSVSNIHKRHTRHATKRTWLDSSTEVKQSENETFQAIRHDQRSLHVLESPREGRKRVLIVKVSRSWVLELEHQVRPSA